MENIKLKLTDSLNTAEHKLKGAQTILDTLFVEFIDGYTKEESLVRLASSHDRFISLMEMLVDYTADAKTTVTSCCDYAEQLDKTT